MTQFSAENILARMKAELKNADSHIEGSFSMDNLQAVSEELARFNAMLIDPLREDLQNKKDELYTSGNERHYEQWAKEVVDGNGNRIIGNARAYGVRDGSGVVYLALISIQAAAPSEAEVQLVENYIATKRPVGAKPIVMAAEPINIKISGVITLKDGYDLSEIRLAAVQNVREYFAENAFQYSQSALNYYRIGMILGAVNGVKEILDYTVNDNRESIPAEYDKYFTLEELVLNGS